MASPHDYVLLIAGVVLFGSLYGLGLTGLRREGAIAPVGGLCLLLAPVATFSKA